MHRLSTIKNSDKIVCMHNGSVLEEGSHTHLMAIENGFYKDTFLRSVLHSSS
jgi:ABC-type transport system involved in Fe-S cluster assembly fused permease/ATPase subunit